MGQLSSITRKKILFFSSMVEINKSKCNSTAGFYYYYYYYLPIYCYKNRIAFSYNVTMLRTIQASKQVKALALILV